MHIFRKRFHHIKFS